jgi:hypothetical protein
MSAAIKTFFYIVILIDDSELCDNEESELSLELEDSLDVEIDDELTLEPELSLELKDSLEPELSLELDDSLEPELSLELDDSLEPELSLELDDSLEPELSLELEDVLEIELDGCDIKDNDDPELSENTLNNELWLELDDADDSLDGEDEDTSVCRKNLISYLITGVTNGLISNLCDTIDL